MGHLVNTSRGGLIAESNLLAALDGGDLAYASLDAVLEEPPGPGSVACHLVEHPRVTATPRMAFLSSRSMDALREKAARTLRDLLRPTPADPSPTGVMGEV